jgi:hypothetical protein
LLPEKKQLAILIVIRRRLTAQGNGQATLDHEGTRRYSRRSGSSRSESERPAPVPMGSATAASARGALARVEGLNLDHQVDPAQRGTVSRPLA